jgi:hypothetical protein
MPGVEHRAFLLRANMNRNLAINTYRTLAASVAPEDLKLGEYVAILNEVIELPSFLWLDSPATTREEPVRIRRIPPSSGVPYKVKAICLPFVFVKDPNGRAETIDVRRAQLARLNDHYAEVVWRSLRKQTAGLRMNQ